MESIWGLKSPTAQTLLEVCAGDSSSHVAGNALVGLHRLGKPGIVEQINSMVNGATHNVRSTAAWTMGRIGDSAFVDPLTELLRDDHPEVRGAALRSLLQIRKAEAAAPEVVAPVIEETPVVPQKVADVAPEVVAPEAATEVEPEAAPEPTRSIWISDWTADWAAGSATGRLVRTTPLRSRLGNEAPIPSPGQTSSAARTGSLRMRFPVAAKIALHRAGAIAGTPASPIPPESAVLATIWTSTTGASSMRSIS